jgi:hypothetical protein
MHVTASCTETAICRPSSSTISSTIPPLRRKLLHTIEDRPEIEIAAPRDVVAHVATIHGTTYIFFANFTGLEAGKVATPASQSGVRVALPDRPGTRMHVLPFLGKENVVKRSSAGTKIHFEVPPLERGTVVWFTK